MAYRYFKDLPRRTASHKLFCDKTFDIAKNPRYNGYQGGLAAMGYKFFDKKILDDTVNNEIMPNQRPLDLAT